MRSWIEEGGHAVIDFCDGLDPVTQELTVAILRDEEGHLRLFEGFLREYQREDLA